MSSNGCREEQEMELEALESLFPVEFEKVSASEFFLSLVPYSDNSSENHVSIKLGFVFGASYPVDSESLEWSVLKSTGCISSDSRLLTDLSDEIQRVREENCGVCCVYQIAERVQEWLREHNEPERSLHDLMGSRSGKAQPVDEEDDSEYEDGDSGSHYSDYSDSNYSGSGDEEDSSSAEEYQDLQLKTLCQESERVKREEFLEWKISVYDQQLLQLGLIKRVAPGDTRTTGKQQFLESLAARKTDEQHYNQPLENPEFNEELFAGEIDADEDDEY